MKSGFPHLRDQLCEMDFDDSIGLSPSSDVRSPPSIDPQRPRAHGVETIESYSAEIKADNIPVKMSRGTDHSIGKTCSVQLTDADIYLCPMCAVDIVTIID